jgi:AcrR family transcriptional regulator
VSSAALTRVLELGPSEDDPVRAQILAAALEQFELVGMRRTTVGDVARRAGIGRVTVYRRIGHKPELVEAAIQLELQRVIELIADAIAPLHSPAERLVEAFVIAVRTLRTHPLLQRLLKTEPEEVIPYLTQHVDPILALVGRFVAEQVYEPGGKYDPELVGELLARLVQSLTLTPGGAIPGDDEHRLREFARTYLTPLVGA